MIELKNLCAGYHGTDVLRGVSMSFEPGRVTVLVGANGCGKSTLLKAAIGMINQKTTAVRVIPAPGMDVGDTVEFGGLLGSAPVMPVHTESSYDFIHRGGRIPAPIHSLKN